MQRIKLIPIETVLEMRENKDDFMLVDVMSVDSFQEGHIPGACNIPLSTNEEKIIQGMDKNKSLVVYCACYHCTASSDAARRFQELGFTNVFDYKAGKQGWQSAGLELEK